jgi:hypothetical protein
MVRHLMSPLGLGRVKRPSSEVGEKPGPVRSQATLAANSGLIPTMFITRIRECHFSGYFWKRF